MNDELTSREHDAMRAGLVAGARRIKPVGAHRMQIIAASVALVLVGGIAGGAIAASTLFGGDALPPVTTPSPAVSAPSTPSPTAMPTASPTTAPVSPAAGIVPFDGDCGQVVSDAEQARIADGAPWTAGGTRLLGIMPDTTASAGLLGGLTCAWSIESATVAGVVLDLFPEGSVPSDLMASTSTFDCDGADPGFCGRAEVRAGMWVHAAVLRVDPYADPTDDERQRLGATIDAVLAAVSGHASADLAGAPASARDRWWTVPECDTLTGSVAAAAGITSPESGYPTDNVPSGSTWRILVADGVSRWCGWYSYSNGEPAMAEIDIQAGVGEPSQALLAEAGAEPVVIAGADAAFVMRDGADESTRGTKVIVVSGPNRLTVGGHTLEAMTAVAAAVVAQLNGTR